MHDTMLQHKEVRAYLFLTSLVICGLASSVITGTKIAHIGIDFPFSNIIFSIFTYPIVDCICELWGKQIARQTLWLALGSQLLITIFIHVSVIAPASILWPLQDAYRTVLSVSGNVILASLIAFSISQILDIFVYQRIKEISQGKWLWLRSNVSTCLGQLIDSGLFVFIVFHASSQKLNIFYGSVLVKIIISILMTPIVYLIVIAINHYLNSNTFAFKNEKIIRSNAASSVYEMG